MSSEKNEPPLPPGEVRQPSTVLAKYAILSRHCEYEVAESWNFSQNAAHSAFHSLRGQAMLVTQPQNPDSQANGSVVFQSAVSGSEVRTIIEVKLQGQSMSSGTVGMVTSPAPRIARDPAARLSNGLRRILTRSAFEGMIAPFIAQEQHEYYEALLRGEFRQAKWIVVRMYWMIGYNLVAAVAASLVRLLSRSAG